MYEIVNKVLLAAYKFMPEMDLREPVFTYSASEPFTKNKEKIHKIKETWDSWYIYQNEPDNTAQKGKFCFKDFISKYDQICRKLAFHIT